LPPDKIIWDGTSNGVFSVKSAYHLGWDLLNSKKGECSSSSNRSDFWKKLWAINAPNSLKKFLWRACQNLLPSEQNLLRKSVVDNVLCPCCNLVEESIVHALWNCLGAQDVWGCGPILFQKCPFIFSGMVELVSYLYNRLNDDLLSLTVAVFHRIWLRRNKLIFEEQFSSPMMVFKEASKLIEDFRNFNRKESLLRAPVVQSLIGCKVWKPPDVGFLKVNWDASVNVNAGVIGLGCVIRNEEGLVMGAKCCVCKAQADPLLAEAMAALLALDFCLDMGLAKIVSEGDSLQIIKGLSVPDSHQDRIGHFLLAIRQKASCFSVCKWAHCCREANEVAHILAKKASSKCLSFCWVDRGSAFFYFHCFS
jgi:ribonuclease HI